MKVRKDPHKEGGARKIYKRNCQTHGSMDNAHSSKYEDLLSFDLLFPEGESFKSVQLKS